MIRKAHLSEQEAIMKLIVMAQEDFKQRGIDQWQNGYPNIERIAIDINEGNGYVLINEDEVVAYYYLSIEEDPYYKDISNGSWLNDEVYGVIHRIVVDTNHQRKGYAKQCLESAIKILKSQDCFNLRIDTHPDNAAMRHYLKINGFQYCGEITVLDGLRYAYQLELKEDNLDENNVS